MNTTIYEQKTTGGKSRYLVSYNDAVTFIDYLEWSNAQAGVSRKITVERYKGRKYNPDTFIWVCVQ